MTSKHRSTSPQRADIYCNGSMVKTMTPKAVSHIWPSREYKGRVVRVTVLADGFEYEGERYKSLTAVAKAATGQHWNGYQFFNLRKDKGNR